ncbi:MAG: sigma 54-interacting transcriptional regulator [Calditrichaeota bacterium]|nr:sigma 54-interacting transcriptional regulator [Calditrichota bacterium]
MDVLLTFTGFHDPFHKGLVEQEELLGPILSLLAARSFSKVILIDTPATREITKQTAFEVGERHGSALTEVIKCDFNDPTDYSQILSTLTAIADKVRTEHESARLFVSTASGTPQMHACWLLITASGKLPATLLQVRPPRFVTKERPQISELDLTSEEFPLIRFRQSSVDKEAEPNSATNDATRRVGIVGEHPELKNVIDSVQMVAPYNTPVMITGESGTGKELFATLTHVLSTRGNQPFVAVNCAALPDTLIESILFGHRRGAFSGATTNQMGKFDAANKGTLFLDEVAELPIQSQGKLLRVLQDGMIEPLGSREPHKVNVRIICATNKDLSKMVVRGEFREDLFFRLNVAEIHLIPLRERRVDIPLLALSILDRLNGSLRRAKQLSVNALNRLQSHNWPGNVRELENVIERSTLLCPKTVIDADDLLFQVAPPKPTTFDFLPEPEEGFSLEAYLKSTRKQIILKALDATKGNQSAAARLLGISPQAVNNFLSDLQRES